MAGGSGGGFLLARAFVDLTTRGYSGVMSQIKSLQKALSSIRAPSIKLPGLSRRGMAKINVTVGFKMVGYGVVLSRINALRRAVAGIKSSPINFKLTGYGVVLSRVNTLRRALGGMKALSINFKLGRGASDLKSIAANIRFLRRSVASPLKLNIGIQTRGFALAMRQLREIRKILAHIRALTIGLGRGLGRDLGRGLGRGRSDIAALLSAITSGLSSIGIAAPGLRNASLAMSALTGATAAFGSALGVATAGLTLLLAGGAILVGTVIGVGTAAFNAASEMQVLESQFTTVLGSAKRAKIAISALNDLAIKTPLQLPEIASAGKLLLGAKVPAGKLVDTIRMLGDIGMPLNVSLQEMAFLFARNRNAAHVFTHDLHEYTTRGIDIVGALADKFGVTRDAIMKMTADGKIQFSAVEEVMLKMTEAGGMFAGGMDRAAKTVQGLTSTMIDSFRQVLRGIGRGLLDPISAAIKMLTLLANVASEVLETFFPEGAGDEENFFTRMSKTIDLLIINMKSLVDVFFESLAMMLEGLDSFLRSTVASLMSLGLASPLADYLGLEELAEGVRQLRRERNARKPEELEGGAEAAAGGEAGDEGKFAHLDLTSFTKGLQEKLGKDHTGKEIADNTKRVGDQLAEIITNGLKVAAMNFA